MILCGWNCSISQRIANLTISSRHRGEACATVCYSSLISTALPPLLSINLGPEARQGMSLPIPFALLDCVCVCVRVCACVCVCVCVCETERGRGGKGEGMVCVRKAEKMKVCLTEYLWNHEFSEGNRKRGRKQDMMVSESTKCGIARICFCRWAGGSA